MVNTTYNSTQDMIDKLQSLKGKTKLKFYQNISIYYVEMDYRRRSNASQCEGDPSSKNAESISKTNHEVLLIMKFLD